MAADVTGSSEDRLQARLGEALAAREPMPAHLADVAKGLFAWRDVDAFLATVTFDSVVDELAGVRGMTLARTVTFECGATEIQIMAAAATERVGERTTHRLICQIAPGEPGASAVLRHPGGQIPAVIGAHGDVEFADVPEGPVQLTVTTSDGVITTEAVTF